MKTQSKLTLLVLITSCWLLPNFSSSQCINATGGTITYTDSLGLNPRSSSPYTAGYTIHTFTGSDTFKVITGNDNVDYLIVAGGGGGGWSSVGGAGGGGAGGMLTGLSHTVTVNSYSVVVGNGGAASTKGGNSSFDGLIAYGGGIGGARAIAAQGALDGGSGGGTGNSAGSTIGYGVPGQGNDGGYGATGGKGGGGAGAVGTNNGGDGLPSSITGTSTYYAGGGGRQGGIGGLGGGGNGGTNGTDGLGGGGGGNNGVGGSGIVIIRYKTCPNTSVYNYSQQTESNGIYIANIFPNPATDKFKYEIGSTEKMTIQVRVVNMLGQIVINETKNITKGISNHTLNVSTLSSGTYILQIISENKDVRSKQFQIQ